MNQGFVGFADWLRGEGLRPRVGSDLLHQGKIPKEWTILVSGRRFIRPEHVGEMRAKLVELGKLPSEEVAA